MKLKILLLLLSIFAIQSITVEARYGEHGQAGNYSSTRGYQGNEGSRQGFLGGETGRQGGERSSYQGRGEEEGREGRERARHRRRGQEYYHTTGTNASEASQPASMSSMAD